MIYEDKYSMHSKNIDPNNIYMRPLNNENFNPNHHMQPFYPSKGNIPHQNYYQDYPTKKNSNINGPYHQSNQHNHQGYQNMQFPQ